MDWQGIGVVVVGILGAYTAYNQHSKDKMTDYKIEKMRADDEERRKREAAAAEARRKKEKSDSHTIFGEIWGLLHALQASRVYIIQPHPLTHASYVSVAYESRDGGLTAMRDVFREMPVGDVAGFVNELRSRDFVYWPTLDDVKDDRARALLHNAGTATIIIKRLMDGDDWVGSLIVDFAQPRDIEIPYVKGLMNEAANSIQYILPEYQ